MKSRPVFEYWNLKSKTESILSHVDLVQVWRNTNQGISKNIIVFYIPTELQSSTFYMRMSTSTEKWEPVLVLHLCIPASFWLRLLHGYQDQAHIPGVPDWTNIQHQAGCKGVNRFQWFLCKKMQQMTWYEKECNKRIISQGYWLLTFCCICINKILKNWGGGGGRAFLQVHKTNAWKKVRLVFRKFSLYWMYTFDEG